MSGVVAGRVRGLRRFLPVLVFLACWQASSPSIAQEAASPAAEQGLSAGQAGDLVSTLENEAERQKLIDSLKALAAAREAQQAAEEPAPATLGAKALAALSERTSSLGDNLGEAAAILFDLPDVLLAVYEEGKDPAARARWLEILLKLAAILVAALLAEWLVRRMLRRPRRAVEGRDGDAFPVRLAFLLLRTFLDILPIAAFAAAAYGVLPLTEPHPVTRLIVLAVVNANVLARVVKALARMLFTPKVSGLRLLPIGDETANYLFLWVRRLSAVSIYGYFFTEAALLIGLPYGAYAVLLRALGLLVATMLAIFILQNRVAVGTWLRGPQEAAAGAAGTLRRRLADIWHAVAILYVYGVYAVWALDIAGGFVFLLRATLLSILVLALAWLLVRAIRHGIERGFRLSDELRQQFPGLEQRANRYLALLQRVLRAAVYIVAGLLLLQVWGFDVSAWVSGETGRSILGRLFTIFLIFLGALIFWEVVSTLVERYLEERGRAEGAESGARLRTLLPLLRNAVRVILVVMVALTILSELGINIAPLLAGAGVVGLAVGFGAQSLVKDVITGVFILLEDSVAVGDVATVGGHTGVVEGLTIRTIRLRDLSGNVHIVPFGEVTTVLNMTKEFSYAVMDVGIAYREDVDKVIEVLKEVGADLQDDPDYRDLILEPLEVLGLDSFGDSAVNIRIRFKTRPVKQWMVRREYNRRMKRRFDELDIEIPFPHQTIYFGVDKEGGAPPARLQIDAAEKLAALAQPPGHAEAPKARDKAGSRPPDTKGVGNEAGEG